MRLAREEDSAGRKVRADAERNRERLLQAAKIAFSAKGSAASLEEIAREAGVGIGTLYRHFPTRDALIEAVYRNEAGQLFAAAEQFAAKLPPAEALRQWLLVSVDYLATKRGMSEALNSLVGGTSKLYEASSTRLKEVSAMLVGNAIASGDIQLDTEPLDLLRALAGVATLSPGPSSTEAAKRFVDILMAGISTRT
ncbi:TetR/AcrR family transcriptional regulator [Hyphomicrobium sp.]|uniref:TetR/AcrR family transcriptional regulator n=1 Tax=Hyphomicrobium sp. TaxID=82 RepID=UPI000FA4AD11|nr:TetR/AcrR family transcriptional regulator [Hyphomicrobium sp.]RUO98438.1 MAG: TetR/AcrR family transcriptional regulator [Hyphomicrobium sp.]